MIWILIFSALAAGYQIGRIREYQHQKKTPPRYQLGYSYLWRCPNKGCKDWFVGKTWNETQDHAMKHAMTHIMVKHVDLPDEITGSESR